MNQDEFNEAERRSKLRMQVIYEGAKKPKREWVGLTDEDYGHWAAHEHKILDWVANLLEDRNT
jgi:hypothetical protein